jgi:hypothetical protein
MLRTAQLLDVPRGTELGAAGAAQLWYPPAGSASTIFFELDLAHTSLLKVYRRGRGGLERTADVRDYLRAARELNNVDADEYVVEFPTGPAEGTWRVRRFMTAEQTYWYALAACPAPPLSLEAIEIPEILCRMLYDLVDRHGLVLWLGDFEAGKTVHMTAHLAGMLQRRAQVAYLFADPVEYRIPSAIAHSHCVSVTIARGQYARAAVDAKRSRGDVVAFGEVRDVAGIHAALSFAADGPLTCTTSFGADLVTGCRSFVEHARQLNPTALDTFAATIAAAIHVRRTILSDGRVRFDYSLVIAGRDDHDPVRNALRSGVFERLGEQSCRKEYRIERQLPA